MAQAYAHWERGSTQAHGAQSDVQRQTPTEEEKKKELTMHRKLQDGGLQRQPEEEEKMEGMLARFTGDPIQRQSAVEEEIEQT